MKEISQEEFESYIEEMIEKRKTRKQAVAELNTSYRTFNNKVQMLAGNNPELYRRYIGVYSITPKERKDIDIIEVGIEFLKNGITMDELEEMFGISKKTIYRKINGLKSSDIPEERELYELVRKVADNHSKYLENSAELEYRIDQLIEKLLQIKKPTETRSSLEIRRDELRKVERRYKELCKTMNGTKAARQMGSSREAINKQINELYCIEIELQARQKEKDFRTGLQVNTPVVTKNDNTEQISDGERIEEERE